MDKIKISANSDLELSRMVLGLWRLNDIPASEVLKTIHLAVELGMTSFDEADIYGNYQSQKYFGRALKSNPSIRHNIQIISKAGIVLPGSIHNRSEMGFYVTTEKHLTQSVEQTLTDLNTDYLNLLLIHRPSPLMNPEELDSAFKKLHQSGKILHFGVSNFTPSQYDMLSQRIETPLVTNQIELSVINTAPLFDGTMDSCLKHDIKPMIWSPLAGGALFTGTSEQVLRVKSVLAEVAKEHSHAGIDQIALAWILKHPAKALPVIGTFKTDRIQAATAALKIDLTDEQWFRILVASQGHAMA